MIVLKCRTGKISEENLKGDRIIICYDGYNFCPKPIDQRIFNEECFTVVEVVE